MVHIQGEITQVREMPGTGITGVISEAALHNEKSNVYDDKVLPCRLYTHY